MKLYITVWRNQINVWWSSPTESGMFGTYKTNELEKAKESALKLISRNKYLDNYTLEKYQDKEYWEWI